MRNTVIRPIADGTIPDDQQNVLLELGSWMKVNGKAIYDTRPWVTYGEGPVKEPEGGFKERKKFLSLQYSAKDIRYTQTDAAIYAIALGWPEQDITMKVFGKGGKAENINVKSISMLGSNQRIKWKKTDAGLVITAPDKKVDGMAVVFRIKR